MSSYRSLKITTPPVRPRPRPQPAPDAAAVNIHSCVAILKGKSDILPLPHLVPLTSSSNLELLPICRLAPLTTIHVRTQPLSIPTLRGCLDLCNQVRFVSIQRGRETYTRNSKACVPKGAWRREAFEHDLTVQCKIKIAGSSTSICKAERLLRVETVASAVSISPVLLPLQVVVGIILFPFSAMMLLRPVSLAKDSFGCGYAVYIHVVAQPRKALARLSLDQLQRKLCGVSYYRSLRHSDGAARIVVLERTERRAAELYACSTPASEEGVRLSRPSLPPYTLL